LRRRGRRAYLGERGLTLTMRDGPSLYFGTTADLRAKWAAAARVLADPTAEGARYVDVRVPERPAAGGLTALVRPDEPEQEAPSPST
jgi:cell division protein FtsQ